MRKIIEKLYYYIFVRNSKWNIVFFLILLSPLFWYIYYKNHPVKQGNYTIGYVTRIYWPLVSHKSIMYSYIIKNKEYINSTVYNSEIKPEVGKRYLIQFSNEDYSFSDIFQDIPVPDSIKNAPPNGWKELPEWAKGNNEDK